MQWERAKNYILITFILLNLGLAGLLYMENRRYTLSPERERIIHQILGENNISLYTHLIRRFPPMRPLLVSGFYYDVNELIEIFFENPDLVERDYDRNVFIYGESELSISNGIVFFYKGINQADTPSQMPSGAARVQASLLTREFINRHYPTFVHDITFESGGGIFMEYREKYRGRLIYSNFIRFFVTHIGIEWIEMQFGNVIGHSPDPRMIFAADEALLTFMQRNRFLAVEGGMFINRIDMVYYKEYVSFTSGTEYLAVPTYRIFIDGNNDIPFLINAFTNMMLD